MNRHGFFGALVGRIATATGLRSPIGSRAFSHDRRITLPRDLFAGRTGQVLSRLDKVLALTGTAPWRTTSAPRLAPAFPAAFDTTDAAAPSIDWRSAPTAPADLPEIWPSHSSTITTTASLPPLDQLETLIELFGASGEAAPSFAAAVIGELVLTRMRLSELRRLHAPAGTAP